MFSVDNFDQGLGEPLKILRKLLIRWKNPIFCDYSTRFTLYPWKGMFSVDNFDQGLGETLKIPRKLWIRWTNPIFCQYSTRFACNLEKGCLV